VGVDQRRARPLAHHLDLGGGIDQAMLDALDIIGQAHAAVGVDATQVGVDQDIGDNGGVGGAEADSSHDRLGEPPERGFGNEDGGLLGHGTVLP